LKKYSGWIYGIRSKAKNGYNNIVSFRACIKTENFKYFKCFPSRQDAESELMRLNQENRLEIKNIMQDCGDYYLVKLSGNKNFLADKCDLHFIENHIWFSNNNYVTCNQNGKQIQFHNLILGHIPIMNCLVDHINRNPLDNRRSNLRIVTHQTQSNNQNPRSKAIQPGVCLDRNHWRASWVNESGSKNTANFSIKRLGYEVAKQLAIAKRLEMELSLNHYRLALHGLPPLEIQELDPNYDFDEPDEI